MASVRIYQTDRGLFVTDERNVILAAAVQLDDKPISRPRYAKLPLARVRPYHEKYPMGDRRTVWGYQEVTEAPLAVGDRVYPVAQGVGVVYAEAPVVAEIRAAPRDEYDVLAREHKASERAYRQKLAAIQARAKKSMILIEGRKRQQIAALGEEPSLAAALLERLGTPARSP